MSSSMGSQDINRRPLPQAKRTLIMENQDIMDRRSSRPATNERPAVHGSNIASILTNPRERSRPSNNRKKLN